MILLLLLLVGTHAKWPTYIKWETGPKGRRYHDYGDDYTRMMPMLGPEKGGHAGSCGETHAGVEGFSYVGGTFQGRNSGGTEIILARQIKGTQEEATKECLTLCKDDASCVAVKLANYPDSDPDAAYGRYCTGYTEDCVAAEYSRNTAMYYKCPSIGGPVCEEAANLDPSKFEIKQVDQVWDSSNEQMGPAQMLHYDGKLVCDSDGDMNIFAAQLICKAMGYSGEPGRSYYYPRLKPCPPNDYSCLDPNADFAIQNLECYPQHKDLSECYMGVDDKRVDGCRDLKGFELKCDATDEDWESPTPSNRHGSGVPGPHRFSLKSDKTLLYGGQPVCHVDFEKTSARIACQSMGYVGAEDWALGQNYDPTSCSSYPTPGGQYCYGLQGFLCKEDAKDFWDCFFDHTRYTFDSCSGYNSAVKLWCGAEATKGCLDENATNYDPDANLDDGSCVYIIPGCMEPGALNYNPKANENDDSCEFPSGCTDASATNYDAEAVEDDGSCEYPSVPGCTDASATNYNSEATEDDGSCQYPEGKCDDYLYAKKGSKNCPAGTKKIQDANECKAAAHEFGISKLGAMTKGACLKNKSNKAMRDTKVAKDARLICCDEGQEATEPPAADCPAQKYIGNPYYTCDQLKAAGWDMTHCDCSVGAPVCAAQAYFDAGYTCEQLLPHDHIDLTGCGCEDVCVQQCQQYIDQGYSCQQCEMAGLKCQPCDECGACACQSYMDQGYTCDQIEAAGLDCSGCNCGAAAHADECDAQKYIGDPYYTCDQLKAAGWDVSKCDCPNGPTCAAQAYFDAGYTCEQLLPHDHIDLTGCGCEDVCKQTCQQYLDQGFSCQECELAGLKCTACDECGGCACQKYIDQGYSCEQMEAAGLNCAGCQCPCPASPYFAQGYTCDTLVLAGIDVTGCGCDVCPTSCQRYLDQGYSCQECAMAGLECNTCDECGGCACKKYQDQGYTCAQVEQAGLDCTGCDCESCVSQAYLNNGMTCATLKQAGMPTEGCGCEDVCVCDEYVEQGISCEELTATHGYDCSGCSCTPVCLPVCTEYMTAYGYTVAKMAEFGIDCAPCETAAEPAAAAKPATNKKAGKKNNKKGKKGRKGRL